jgi:hypothetical protein
MEISQNWPIMKKKHKNCVRTLQFKKENVRKLGG